MESFDGRSWLVAIMSRNTISILHFFLTLQLALGSDEARNLLRGKHIRVLLVEVRIWDNLRGID
jgi:hypothetical protein